MVRNNTRKQYHVKNLHAAENKKPFPSNVSLSYFWPLWLPVQFITETLFWISDSSLLSFFWHTEIFKTRGTVFFIVTHGSPDAYHTCLIIQYLYCIVCGPACFFQIPSCEFGQSVQRSYLLLGIQVFLNVLPVAEELESLVHSKRACLHLLLELNELLKPVYLVWHKGVVGGRDTAFSPACCCKRQAHKNNKQERFNMFTAVDYKIIIM